MITHWQIMDGVILHVLNSLKSWLDVPLRINTFLSADGAGDKSYSAPVDVLCYPVYMTVKTVNKEGTEIVSNTQLYLDGIVAISTMDTVVLNGTTYVIKHLSGFSRNGVPDIWVVYL
jgi:hypothetical protein